MSKRIKKITRHRLITALWAFAMLFAIWAATESTSWADEIFAVRTGKVHTAGEAGVIENATIVVKNGKIEAILRANEPFPPKNGNYEQGTKFYDLRAHVIIPGLIDAETTLASSTRDTRQSVAPEVRAIDGWDFFRELDDELEAGVTTVYLAAGVSAGRSSRLVSGRGGVVKTAGRDSHRLKRVVRDAVGVQVTLGEFSRRQPSIYDPPVGATPDNPFEVLQRPLPQSRVGEFLALRQLLTRATTYRAALETHLTGATSAAVFPLLEGRDHLRVRANKARDIYHALELARETGVPLVLEGAAEAERLTPWLVEMGVPVIFPGAFRPGSLLRGDLAAPALEGRLDEEAILRMHKAGVKVVLNSPSDSGVKNLLLQAASAVRLGMSEAEALRTITLNPARVLGVDDRVGSIEVGKDADFVVLGGDLFGADSKPQAVVIEGEVVFREAPEIDENDTVIRCGRIITAAGRDIVGGVVLVKDGKVEYAGPGAFLPSLDKAKKVIDAVGSTVIPGLIDAGSPAGLRAAQHAPSFSVGDGGWGASSSAALRLADSIDPRDPSLRPLVRAGFTTAMITPNRGRDVSGQISAFKLAAKDTSKAIVKPYAALHFGALSSRTLKSAKDYHDSWEKWEDKRDAAKKAGKEFKDDPPKKSKSYEPFRTLFDGDVPAVVEATSASSAAGIVKLLKEQYGARVILGGLPSISSDKDFESAADVLRKSTEGAILQIPFTFTRGSSPAERETINRASAFASRGVQLSLRSGVSGGARQLPLQVALAVRDGWDARQALRSMTSVPAKQFGIADRVGSIQKGRDADIVFLSGEPFAVTTQVQAVMVDGRVVHGVGSFETHVEE